MLKIIRTSNFIVLLIYSETELLSPNKNSRQTSIVFPTANYAVQEIGSAPWEHVDAVALHRRDSQPPAHCICLCVGACGVCICVCVCVLSSRV